MLLTKLEIKNFRYIGEVSLRLNEIAVLIGGYYTDSATILCALDLCMSEALSLGENVFNPSDFQVEDVNSEPPKVKPIEIKLFFQETEQGEWDEYLGTDLVRAVRVNGAGCKTIILQVTGKFDVESKNINTDQGFIDLEGKIIPAINMFTTRQKLHQMVAVCLLSSLREAGQKFLPGSKFWESIFAESQLSKATLAKIVANLKNLEDRIDCDNRTVKSIVARLSKISDILSQGSEKLILDETVLTKSFDSPSPTESDLASTFNDFLPIATDGSGGQRIAALLLIDAILRAQVLDATNKPAHPILALERPELRLDMMLQSIIAKFLPEIPGQKIITTNSERILSAFDFRDIIRLDYSDRKLFSHQIKPEQMEQGMTEAEASQMWKKLNNWSLRFDWNCLLYRCWLLVAGEDESMALWQSAISMGINFHDKSVSVIKYNVLNVEYLLKLADQFGIKWFLLADTDEYGQDKVQTAHKQLDGREPANHICQLDHGNMDQFLRMHGFGNFDEEYEENEDEQETTVDMVDDLDGRQQAEKYQTSDSNVEEAAPVTKEIAGLDMPAFQSQLEEVVKQVVKLSGSQNVGGFLGVQ